ncbi:hypothetical protein FSP39_025136 [Pinctada imbricata]|uniref:C-type lectin domain-containing protein n=1 Tax=Pinctada imbricata TaxID=66713 RepID=A0AA88YRN5_PINIB|nr:hypothetical protein FSP39_025136 [Pinctada imbricata]
MCQTIKACGGHLGFQIGSKNTNLVEGIKYLLPVKFREIPCSRIRGEVESVSAKQSLWRPSYGSLDLCPTSLPQDQYLKVFGGKCYRYRNDELNWPQAKSQCSTEGGHLAEIPDWETHNDLEYNADGLRGDRVWIGLNDINKRGRWIWDNGNSMSYTNWDSGQPDTCSSCEEKCVLMRIDRSGKWHDYGCYTTHNPFICEYGKPFFLSFHEKQDTTHIFIDLRVTLNITLNKIMFLICYNCLDILL